MTAWILDDGPFNDLAKIVRIEDLTGWPKDRLFVAEQTALDAESDSHRRTLLAADPTPFQSFKIMMGSPAFSIVYSHLRPTTSRATANLAEHQSIAWIISERPDGIFVAKDKKAAFLALAELGCGKVASPHDLWLWLRDEKLVDQTQFEGLCRTTCKGDQSRIPLRCQ